MGAPISNPLFGWLGQSGVNPNQFGTIPQPTTTPSINTGPLGNPGGLDEPASNIKDAWRNQAFLNTMMEQFRLGLAPEFANLMKGYAGPAANFMSTLMNLGSPFYQQKQRASFEQGVGQSQNAAAQARQQLRASGAGYTPSGTAAAMFGGMGQAAAGNQAEVFLNNLFQNEQLQMAGAQGLAGIAGMFNPASLLQYSAPQSTQGPTFGSQFKDILGGLFGGGGALPGGVPGL